MGNTFTYRQMWRNTTEYDDMARERSLAVRNKATPERDRRISVLLKDPSLKGRLRAMAEHNRRDLSGQCEVILQKAVQESEAAVL